MVDIVNMVDTVDTNTVDTDMMDTDVMDTDAVELFVDKTFQSWNHVANFMKRYAASKGHGIRIGGGSKVNKVTNKVIK